MSLQNCSGFCKTIQTQTLFSRIRTMFDVNQILFAVNCKQHEDTWLLEPRQMLYPSDLEVVGLILAYSMIIDKAWRNRTIVHAILIQTCVYALNLVLFITTKIVCSEFNLDI